MCILPAAREGGTALRTLGTMLVLSFGKGLKKALEGESSKRDARRKVLSPMKGERGGWKCYWK